MGCLTIGAGIGTGMGPGGPVGADDIGGGIACGCGGGAMARVTDGPILLLDSSSLEK